MLATKAMTSVLFLTLLQAAHDREVVERFRREGKIPTEEVVNDNSVVHTSEDGALHYLYGVREEETTWQMQRIRQIRDTLDNAVRHYYGKNEEVTKWADSLGGLRKVQEKLCGLSLGKKGWFHKTLSKLKDELGYDVPPMGEPINEVPSDSAGHFTTYQTEVFRLMKTRRAYGELDDDEETLPNWAASEFDFNISNKPWWWSSIRMGMFRKNALPKDHMVLKQVETSSPGWIPDIRISAEIGSVPFKKLTDLAPWWQIQDHPVVREFIHRFYNDPSSLSRKIVGREPKTRWAFGMLCKSGYIWAPVTYKSNETLKYFSKPKENKERKGTRCLYIRQYAISYKVVGDQKIRVQKMEQCDNTGLWKIWNDKIMNPKEWGSLKRELLKMGAVDAYLGRPWKKFQPTAQQTQYNINQAL